jgi:hypothetical protein
MKTYLNTPAIFGQKGSKVDRENGIISDVIVSAMGEAKGHELFLNSNFLDGVVKLAGENPQGIKARFGHPNICATALGTYLGRYKNYRRIDNTVVADLHLDDSAKKSPNGDLHTYVLDMAENNPDMFGASIAFKRDKDIVELEKNDNGKEIKKTYATIKALYATDLVDSPAATDGLFEAFHQDDFASQVTMFLDENPKVYALLAKKPQILDEFLTNYKHYKSENQMSIKEEITSLKNWITDNFAEKNPVDLSTVHQSIFDNLKSDFETKLAALPKEDNQLTELTEKIQTVSDANSQLSADNLAANTKLSELQTKFDTLTSDFNKLQATKSSKPNPTDPNITLGKPTGNVKHNALNGMPESLRSKLRFKKTD